MRSVSGERLVLFLLVINRLKVPLSNEQMVETLQVPLSNLATAHKTKSILMYKPEEFANWIGVKTTPKVQSCLPAADDDRQSCRHYYQKQSSG